MKRYNPVEIEKKWQKVWEQNETYKVDFSNHTKPKYYGMSMLAGVTGSGIHVGHGRTYQFSDIKVRAKRQQGFNAYMPIGWDSFGLPVESYAIKIGKTPRIAHDEVLVNFKNQLKRLGYSYDWSKEISTADPSYYKWTQWIFNQLYKHGLAYQKQSPQWWCETDQTVLANEQVEGGKCWRCGNQVSKKNLKQWFFKITDYAEEILEATDALDWTEMVKTMQKNWIGRSEGAEVDFKIEGSDKDITVFTTRPDTLFGATFIVLAPEHELVKSLSNDETREKVGLYVSEAASKSEIERMNETREKTGVFTGSYAINPVNNEKLPIWVADYVLSGYGTGAIMAVPAHDERDFEFANKFNIAVTYVIEKPNKELIEGLYAGEGIMINSGKFNGMQSSEAREKIVSWLEEENTGKTKVSFKMRDWLISRQRYWGAPIPIIHCDDCGAVPVPDDQLPVILPDIKDFKPKDGNVSALAGETEWLNVPCPKCGKPAKRETDTMDGYACSSWYFLRYLDPFNDKQAWDPEVESYWGPVDYYNGADHAVAHLLYARFWQRFFYKLGLVSTPEPFKHMMYNAHILATDGSKMSKSRGNVVDPLEIIDSGYGADSLRVYEIFIAPYDLEAPWDTRGVPGTYRFLNRVWTLVQEYIESGKIDVGESISKEILVVAHKTAKKVTSDIEEEKFNTAISSMMEAVNNYYKIKSVNKIGKSESWDFAIESLLQILSPFAPHITEELWSQIGHTDTIHIDYWPKWDNKYLQTDITTIVIQVNSKVRAKIEVETGTGEEEVKMLALEQANVVKFLEGKKPTKVIYIAGRLVNIVC
ncbi:MAG: leucine--tRNA ligase [Candidatus Saccharibacteria bacterium]